MELLKKRIAEEAIVINNDVLRVDMFINHQIDVELINAVGKEFHRIFKDCGITRILTIEASGIGIACAAAQHFSVPVVFARKGRHKNVGDDVYSSKVYSFTKDESTDIRVSKKYMLQSDNVLILDDFLANGSAAMGLVDIVRQAGARVAGAGIVIEKGFQPGGRLLRSEGIRLESLAVIKSMENGFIEFE